MLLSCDHSNRLYTLSDMCVVSEMFREILVFVKVAVSLCDENTLWQITARMHSIHIHKTYESISKFSRGGEARPPDSHHHFLREPSPPTPTPWSFSGKQICLADLINSV